MQTMVKPETSLSFHSLLKQEDTATVLIDQRPVSALKDTPDLILLIATLQSQDSSSPPKVIGLM